MATRKGLGMTTTIVDGIEIVHEIVDGFQTWTWINPKTGDRLRLRYQLRDRLHLYIDHGKSGNFYWTMLNPIMCGEHPEEVAHAWITGKLPEYWQNVGREAYANGEHAAPALNERVRACLDVKVGTPGTTDLMRWFTEGWTAANLAAGVPEESTD